MFRGLLNALFYPGVFLLQALHHGRHGVGSVIAALIGFVIALLSWSTFAAITLFAVEITGARLGAQFGLLPQPIEIAGTGSMYPTFPKGTAATDLGREQQDVAAPLMYHYPSGITLFGHQYFVYTLKRGDIVSFSNATTNALIQQEGADLSRTTGFVKRVIAMPGDTLQIRDGFVILNGKTLAEPYTAEPRSTFGGEFIPDCANITVPPGKLVVMGDNRKGSSDSRNALGFINITDIDSVLPFERQTPFEALWHDPSHDTAQANKPELDPQQYLKLLNAIRIQHGVPALKYDARLEQSARARANVMLKYDDLSFEATKSGYTAARAMADAGYQNIVWGEAPTLGYYTAQELVENYSQSPSWQKFLLDKTYQDTGIAAVVGNLNGCPVQLVVQHVAGYVPPNYSQSDIQSWQNLQANLQKALPSWENARNFGDQYTQHKNDYERIITIIQQRLNTANSVVATMQANQWLTNSEKAAMAQDMALAAEENQLANKLNGQ
jgi:signal peptidase I